MFSNALYQTVLDSSPAGHYLLSPSPDPIILSVNDTFLQAVSRKREDLVGKRLFAVFPRNPVDPCDTGIAALRNSLVRVIATGKKDVLPLQRYPITVVAPDGRQHYEERYWNAVSSPIIDEHGKLLYILHSTTDVTEQARAESELKKRQACYHSLIESIDEGFCRIQMIFDEQGQPVDYWFCEVNPEFEAQTGLHDAVGKRMRELAPEHEAHWFEIYGQVAKTRKAVRFQNVAKTLNRWYDVYAYPVDEPEAAMVCILFRDITSARLQNEALQEASERRAFLLKLSDALRNGSDERSIKDQTIKMLAEHLKVDRCWISEVFERQGFSTVGPEHICENLPPMSGVFQLADYPETMLQLATQPMVIDDAANDQRFPESEKKLLADLHLRSLLVAPLRKGQHQVIWAIAAAMSTPRQWTDGERVLLEDVAERTWAALERIRSDTELRATQLRLQLALTAAHMGTWSWQVSADLHRRDENLSRLLGQEPVETVMPVEQFFSHIHPDDRDQIRAAFDASVRHGHNLRVDFRVVWPDGQVRWLSDQGDVFGAGEGRYLAGACVDITDRKRMEEALRESDRRKDEFLAMLAHELRNPLAPISAAANLLGLVPMGEEKIRQTSEIISRQVRHMKALIDDLLDVSRVTRGHVKLDKAKIDVKRIIADSVEQVRPLIEARGHGLAVHTPPQPAFVVGDHKRLVQVLSNLLSNAAKYTPDRGNIVLSMEIEGGHVKTTVTDNGIGMTNEMAARAFELFTQAERSSDRRQGGLGIGLALAKSLVESHGGTISVTCEGPGKGSRFTVCLPALIEQADLAKLGPDPETMPSLQKRFKVMVVDDNVDAAQTLSMLLEASGYQVLVEYNAANALQRARAEKPSVFLLDIGMPEMDGNELARRLRAEPETAHSLLIAVTGYGRDQDRETIRGAGFDHHLVKPVDIKTLASILAEVKNFYRPRLFL